MLCPGAAESDRASCRGSSRIATRGRPGHIRNPNHALQLPPDKLAKAKALYELRGKLRIFDTIYGIVVLLGLLYLGIAGKFRDIAEAAGKNRFVQALIFVALFLVTTHPCLPLDAYQQNISLQYGLSVQGWGSWLGDQLKGMLVALVIFTSWPG